MSYLDYYTSVMVATEVQAIKLLKSNGMSKYEAMKIANHIYEFGEYEEDGWLNERRFK